MGVAKKCATRSDGRTMCGKRWFAWGEIEIVNGSAFDLWVFTKRRGAAEKKKKGTRYLLTNRKGETGGRPSNGGP